VRLEVEVPDELVLLSHYWLWEDLYFFCGLVPGGNWGSLYALRDEMTAAGLLANVLLEGLHTDEIKELEAAGFKNEYDHILRALEHPILGQSIRESWEVVFNLDLSCKLKKRPNDNHWQQATFWEIHLEQVLDVRTYTNPSKLWKSMSANQKKAYYKYELQHSTPLKPKVTGLTKPIWISEQSFNDDKPWIKISTSARATPGNWGEISISDKPRAQRGLLNKINREELQLAKDWIRLNKDILLEHWRYGLDETDLMNELKSLDRR
jgi:hypothetical protein